MPFAFLFQCFHATSFQLSVLFCPSWAKCKSKSSFISQLAAQHAILPPSRITQWLNLLFWTNTTVTDVLICISIAYFVASLLIHHLTTNEKPTNDWSKGSTSCLLHWQVNLTRGDRIPWGTNTQQCSLEDCYLFEQLSIFGATITATEVN